LMFIITLMIILFNGITTGSFVKMCHRHHC
jgi:hypothetical protein